MAYRSLLFTSSRALTGTFCCAFADLAAAPRLQVIPCTKRFVHDWTICPFAHAGEKAVRRDPRLHNYTGIACPDMKKASRVGRGAVVRGFNSTRSCLPWQVGLSLLVPPLLPP